MGWEVAMKIFSYGPNKAVVKAAVWLSLANHQSWQEVEFTAGFKMVHQSFFRLSL
jgi:hypothetical protein